MSIVKFSLTDRASRVFDQIDLDPKKYCAAYQGESSGLDLYNVGPEINVFGRTKWSATGENPALVPVGIKLALPLGTVGLIRGRGSIIKTSLMYRGGVIDPGFSGEIFVNVINVGENDAIISTGTKLPFQLVVVPCLHDFRMITDLEYLKDTKNFTRKERSLGSTN